MLIGVFQIAIREHDASANTLDRLGDVSRDLSRSGVIDDFLHVSRVLLAGVYVITSPNSAKRIRRNGVMHTEAVRHVELPGAMRGQAHGDGAAAVVGIAQ